jgi:hypothetical protein
MQSGDLKEEGSHITHRIVEKIKKGWTSFFFHRLLSKSQFAPTLIDTENGKLNELAKKLKGDSEKESLTNILEWQAINIEFWWERWPVYLIFIRSFLLLFFYPYLLSSYLQILSFKFTYWIIFFNILYFMSVVSLLFC